MQGCRGDGDISPLIAPYVQPVSAFSLESINACGVKKFREQFNAIQRKLNATLPDYNLLIQNSVVETAHGRLAVREYRPQGEKRVPTLVFLHGGGFVLGDLDTLEGYCRELAHFARCQVLSVDYPLAPENPFPIPVEATYQAMQRLYKREEVNRERFFVGGSSAGATLATVAAYLAKSHGGPSLSGQILLCPMTDTDFETQSYRENGTGYRLTREMCQWFVAQYVQEKSHYSHPLVAPLRIDDLEHVAKALVVTAEFDPLRDEMQAYTKRLGAANVSCQEICYKGMIHGFYTLPVELEEKRHLLETLSRFLHE